MYITQIELTNIRCFKHLKIDLSSGKAVKKWLMILGDNGVGKTTLLRCIAMGLCDEASAAALLRDTSGEMIRVNEDYAVIKLKLEDEDNGRAYTITTKITKSAHFETIRQKTYPSGQFPWEKIFACGYGSNRRTEGDISYDSYMVSDAVYTLFNYDFPLQNPELAIRRYAETDEESKEICQWLDEILMLDKDSTEVTEVGIKVRDKSGNIIPLGALADGYQATLTLVLDMLGWAMLAGQKEKKSKLSGIVLIDEIDQHLHPSWQRKIISLLESRFPNIQFIVASHSPLCAGGIADLLDEKCDLQALVPCKEGFVANESLSTMSGWRYDEILTSRAFGVPARNVKTQDLLDKLKTLYMKDSLSNAEDAELKELQEELKEVSLPGTEAAERRKVLDELNDIRKKLENGNDGK